MFPTPPSSAPSSEVTQVLEEVHSFISSKLEHVFDADPPGQDNESVSVQDFLQDCNSYRNVLEQHIVDYKTRTLPITREFTMNMLQLVTGVFQTDLGSFTAMDQTTFASDLLDLLGTGFYESHKAILRCLQNGDLKMLGTAKSATAKPERFLQGEPCLCPVTGHVNDVCLARSVLRCVRLAVNFYDMVQVNETVSRPVAVKSLEKYRTNLMKSLARIRHLSSVNTSSPCLNVIADKTGILSTLSTPSKYKQRSITDYFLTPEISPTKMVTGTTDQRKPSPPVFDLCSSSSELSDMGD